MFRTPELSERVNEQLKGVRTPQKFLSKHITESFYRPGPGDVVLKDSGIPIWAIIGHAKIPDMNIEEVMADYGIPRNEVVAALGYYRRYRPIIDARLLRNKEFI